MGQKILDAGVCDYCESPKKAVYYSGLYPQDEELLEIHCNTCRTSWNPDGSLRALPSVSKLTELGVLQKVLLKGLPFSLKACGEWANRDENPTSKPTTTFVQEI